jgi:hypothetical protein
MRNFVTLAIVVALGWYGYSQYQRRAGVPMDAAAPSAADSAPESQFKCDGRIYCSQMTSCAEATYFLRNCSGTKMDGNNDGVPCEQQWFKRPYVRAFRSNRIAA